MRMPSSVAAITGSFDIDASAVKVIAGSGPPQIGISEFQRVKASISISGGKIGQVDIEDLAKNWAEPSKMSF